MVTPLLPERTIFVFIIHLWLCGKWDEFSLWVVVVKSLSHVQLFVTPWTTAYQASLSITNSWSPPKPMSVQSAMPFNHLILYHPHLLPSIFPNIRSFPMSQLFTSGSQRNGASASSSVLPINIHGWFPLRLTGLICFKSKELSRIFSNTTVLKHQFFGAQPSLWSSSHIRTWTSIQDKP